MYASGVGGCYNSPCSYGTGDGCYACNTVLHGGKWVRSSSAEIAKLGGGKGARAPNAASASSIPGLTGGGKGHGAKPKGPKKAAVFLKRQAIPRQGGPTGGGAVPRQGGGGGAVPRVDPLQDLLDQLKGPPAPNMGGGAVPRDPLQDLLDQLKGPPAPGGVKDPLQDLLDQLKGGQPPRWPSNGGGGATPNNSWGALLDRLRDWLARQGYGSKTVKRNEQKIGHPNRITIEGHKFKLDDAMPQEHKATLYNALFNHTLYEDLSQSLLQYELKN